MSNCRRHGNSSSTIRYDRRVDAVNGAFFPGGLSATERDGRDGIGESQGDSRAGLD